MIKRMKGQFYLFGMLLFLIVGVNVGSTYADAIVTVGTTDKHVHVPQNVGLQPTTAITYETWASASSWTTVVEGAIIDYFYWTGSTIDGYYLAGGGQNAGGLGRYYLGLALSTGDHLFLTNYAYSLNTWYHIAVTYNSSEAPNYPIRVYVNGNLVTTRNTAGGTITYTTVNGNPAYGLNIGYFRDINESDEFQGTIDEVRIWNSARTQADIQDARMIELVGCEPNLLGYWKLNEGSGQTIADSSGNGHNGTLGFTSAVGTDDPAWTTSGAPITAHDDTTISAQTGVADLNSMSNPALSGGLIVANVSFFNQADDCLTFGHNNLTGISTDDLGSTPSASRFARLWYVEKRDVLSNGGNVSFTFDFSDAGVSPGPSSTNPNDYRLLYRAGTTGDFTEIAQASAISGDQVIFGNVATFSPEAVLNGYYTVGSILSPTAVTLQSQGLQSVFTIPMLFTVALGLLLAGLTLVLLGRQRRYTN